MQKTKLIHKILEKNIYVYILLLLLGCALYANTLKGPFLWDDIVLIVNNEYIRSFEYVREWFTESALSGAGKTHSNLYRPFTTFVNTTIYALFGASALAYRVLLILLHTINSYLVFKLFQNLSWKKIISFVAALIFLVHPVHAEAVAYIAGGPDVISSFWILLGLVICSSQNFTKKKLLFFSLPLVFILALLSKEIGIILFPLVGLLAIYKWKKYSQEEKKTVGYTLGILTILTVTYVTLKMTVLNFTGSAGLTFVTNEYVENIHIRIITFFGVIWEYIRLILFPKTLLFEKPTNFYTNIFSPQVLFGIVIVVSGLITSYFSFKKGNKKIFLGFFWFFLALAPVSGVIVANTTYAERWLYIPIIGAIILLIHGYETLQKKPHPRIVAAILIIILIALGTRTVYRNYEWANPTAFLKKEISLNPLSPRLHTQLGAFEFERGNYNRAITQFEQAVQKDVDGILYAPRHNMANAYFKTSKYRDALYWYFDALYIHPRHINALRQVGVIEEIGGVPNSNRAKIQNTVKNLLLKIQNGEAVSREEIVNLENLFQ